ncbi:hypothetical protein BAUCODRAFT_62859 [Baudoinia panamericana UAMH 10762]|uniref:Ureidoglycolate hydrolase n=1 Tax=Baudoinia panamericana (strain UAMH 10762) TaxID=717646 RepID=M2NM54_BAUPA|nr:uncharacterized protein BAUCODRAFT_62859 [Baudoinia panamericana UAMH 10762]EMD00256.1 hypothetical protein BAUCODRAFT_62859 [Baudoinia panamericana UAMH 10762]
MVAKISASSRLIPVEPLHPSAFAPFGEVIQNPATHDNQPSLSTVEANQGSATKCLDVTSMRNWYELSQSKKPASVKMNMFVCRPRKLQKRNGEEVFDVKILERHPFTPQTFVPLGLAGGDRSTSFLVIVAPTLPLNPRLREKEGIIDPAYPVPAPQRKRSLRERLLGARPNPFTNDFMTSITATSEPPLAHRPKGPGLPDLDNLRAFIARGDQAVTYGAGTWHAPMVVLGEQPVDFVVVQYMSGVALDDVQEVEIESSSDGLAVNVHDMAFADAGGVRSKL